MPQRQNLVEIELSRKRSDPRISKRVTAHEDASQFENEPHARIVSVYLMETISRDAIPCLI